MAHAKQLFLLTAFTFLILRANFVAYSYSEYSFRDTSGNEVNLPDRPQISLDSPGALIKIAPEHTPKIHIKTRHDGLEAVRVLEFELSAPVTKDQSDPLLAIYIADKDGLMIGHKSLNPGDYKFSIVINGVINFVYLYVECQDHGLWTKTLSLNLEG